MSTDTDDTAFDQALVTSALNIAAERGWLRVNLAEAARAADLPIDRTRERFPHRLMVLQRLGQMLDSTALSDIPSDGVVRDALFDMLMRRFDGLQTHRAGVLAVMDALPLDLGAAAMLACGTQQSMRWMLEGAAVDTTGVRGELRVKGLVGVWLWGVRAWRQDASSDLSATMVAVDNALRRADEFAGWLGGKGGGAGESIALQPESAPIPANDSDLPSGPDSSQPV